MASSPRAVTGRPPRWAAGGCIWSRRCRASGASARAARTSGSSSGTACGRTPAPERPRSDGNAPEGEPALELGLDRQLAAQLGLDLQLALGVALLLAARRHERVPRAALVVV